MKRLLLSLLLILAASTAGLRAQVCKSAGNVEVAVTPDQVAPNGFIKVTFTNFNSYQVTTCAKITLAGEKGAEKTYARTFVIPGKGKKEYNFSTNDLGGELILPRDCCVTLNVQKCDSE